LKRAGGKYEFLRYRHDPIVGVLPGSRYSAHTFLLYPGDSIFVYTDGVPEAVNEKNELFGEERILSVLNGNQDMNMETLLSSVREGIDEFAAGLEAYDDITMIGFRFFGNDKER
jgi:serine phosphatase RsbU (regulator of sigma subunit)